MIHEQELTERIIGALIEVHRALGPGLLESVYQACTAREFALRGLSFEQEKAMSVVYKDIQVDCGYRLDFVVAGEVVVELKAVEALLPVHEAQLLTYMRLRKVKLGFLLNWKVVLMKQGIKRMIL